MSSNIFRALALTAAVLSSFVAQGVSARTLWTVDGPMIVADTVAPATRGRTPLASTASPAQNALELSGATGGGGQHS